MFQFPGLASRQVGIVRHDPDWVAPFGNLRIYACVPLPEAYRSLPRPSSPVCAKASTIRPLTLDHHLIPTRNDSQMVHRITLFSSTSLLENNGQQDEKRGNPAINNI